MKFAASLTRSLQADMRAELRDLERAVAAGTRSAGQSLKTELRRQVAGAGLGQRLANSWRDKHYPNQRLDAASLVYTKAAQIIRALDEGAVIRSRRGPFLAIPSENAPKKGTDGRRISASTFPEHRFGPLRFSVWVIELLCVPLCPESFNLKRESCGCGARLAVGACGPTGASWRR